MRVLAAILLFSLVLISTGAYAQNTITCHAKDVPLRKVFDDIYNQTGYYFFFKKESGLMDQVVTVDFSNMSIDNFLKSYFGVSPSDYKIEERTYVIRRKERTPFGFGLNSSSDALVDLLGTITDGMDEPLSGATIAVTGGKPIL